VSNTPTRPRKQGGGILPLVLGVSSGLMLVVLLVGIGGWVLSQRNSTATPTATAEVGIEPTAEIEPTPPPATAAPPTATRPFAGKNYVVANTGGDGVYLRKSTNLEDRDTAYPDGTILVQIGPDVEANGLTWRHVRTPDDKTGYVPAQYTEEAP
jgi:hypothetical protein